MLRLMKYTGVIASSSAPPLEMPRVQTLSFPRRRESTVGAVCEPPPLRNYPNNQTSRRNHPRKGAVGVCARISGDISLMLALDLPPLVDCR